MKKNSKEISEENKKVFCSECGSECNSYIESAAGWSSMEMYLLSYSPYTPVSTYPKFNSKGEPNMMKVWECPNRKVKKMWGIRILEDHTKKGERIGNFY